MFASNNHNLRTINARGGKWERSATHGEKTGVQKGHFWPWHSVPINAPLHTPHKSNYVNNSQNKVVQQVLVPGNSLK